MLVKVGPGLFFIIYCYVYGPPLDLWKPGFSQPYFRYVAIPLRWGHNGRDSVSNHQPHDCLLNRLFRRRSKKISKLHATGLCVGNSPGTGEFFAQMASNAENDSIWWRHHAFGNDVHVKRQNDMWSRKRNELYASLTTTICFNKVNI